MTPRDSIECGIGQYVATKRRHFAGTAITWTGLAVLLYAITVICTDVLFGLPSAVRWSALFLLGALGIAGLTFRFVVPSLRYRRHEAIREIEQGCEDLGQMLRTSSDVTAMENPEERGFSASLIQALLTQTERKIASLDLPSLISWSGVKRKFFWCAVVFCMMALTALAWRDFRVGLARLFVPGADIGFTRVAVSGGMDRFERGDEFTIHAETTGRVAPEAMLFTRVKGEDWKSERMKPESARQFAMKIAGREKTFDYYVSAGDGKSKVRTAVLIDPPKIESVEADLQYPSYTGLKPAHLDKGDLEGVEGTQAVLRFHLSHALSQAALRIGDKQSVPATIEGDVATVAWTLPVCEAKYSLEGCDADNLPVGKNSYKVHGLKDQPPEVEIVLPREDVEVTALTEVPIRFRAQDDFGLGGAGLTLKVDGKEEPLRSVQLEDGTIQTMNDDVALLLEKYDVNINSNIQLYAWASDRKPGEGQRSVSALRAVDIRPFLEKYRLGGPG
jgi:hypothetical protein